MGTVKQIQIQLKLPKVIGLTLSSKEYYWRKDGGYAGGTVVNRAITRAKEAGWVLNENGMKSSVDGGLTNTTKRYISPNGKFKLETTSYRGVEVSDNYYTIIITTTK